MGTRGLIGIRIDGDFFGVYNHFDSYPEGLGKKVVKFINHVNKKEKWDQFKKRIRQVTLVDEANDRPNKHLQAKYLKYADLSVSTQSLSDWYCLTRKTHYAKWLYEVLKGKLKHLINGTQFLYDTVFCEYAYILDLDNDRIEFHDPPNLLGLVDFDKIPENWMNLFYGVDESEN